jgi:hypothetical protein
VFGGITESDKDTMSVQCFDTRHHTVTICGDLSFSCRLTRTIALDTAVYVMAPDGRVIEFCDSSLNIHSQIQMKRSRSSSSGLLQIFSTKMEESHRTMVINPLFHSYIQFIV